MVLPKPKRILYDEKGNPVFVEFDYEDWLILEAIIEALPEPDEPYVPLSDRAREA